MAACPYNARVFNWSEPDHDPDFQTGFKDVPAVRPRGVMEKRTLRKERCDADSDNEPMCVVCCPSSARVYGDLDAPDSEISKIGQQIFGLGITGMSNGTSWAAMPVPDNDKDAWQCHPFRAGDGTLQNVQRQLHGVQRFARLQRSIVNALEEVSFRHQPKRTQVFGGHSPLSAIGSTPKKTLALSLLV